ncbi:phBC6A51 family helix-turn-helix protein [Heyndrickxia sp. FSL W8-0496]|uniref:phBC6A51 family helix-turn-helix protein n=1 Tax=Heyndrickxia sp. FSL W8-0496 TaxID=2954702 RepID=UPI0030FAD982
MKENLQKITPKQEKAILSLLTEPTIRQAAEKSGVGETTLYRWMQEEEFDKAFKDARAKALNQTISQLQSTSNNAVRTLKNVMEDEKAPASSRVTAAKTVLEMAFKAYELQDLASKIEEMEKYIEEQIANG